MARTSRNIDLETRTKRFKLEKGKRHWQTVGKGLGLGYRLGTNGGTWYARKALADNKYAIRSIGIADDYQEADGEHVLNYFQAQNKAREDSQKTNIKKAQYTVEKAIEDYLDNYKIENKPKEKTLKSTESVIKKHITTPLGNYIVNELTYRQLINWRNKIAKPDLSNLSTEEVEDEELIYELTRKKQASTNRIINYLKAILNYSYSHNETITDDSAWKKLKPFRDVDADNVRPLTVKESKRLLNVCDPDFRLMVRAALYTGCRYSELATLKVKNVDVDSKRIIVTKRVAKSSKLREIPLNADGYKFIDQQMVGKLGNDLLFIRDDGSPWDDSHQKRRMDAASDKAKLNPTATFHNLRDTYASILVSSGVPLKAVADLLGHSDTRITERCYARFQQSEKDKLVKNHLPSFGIEKLNVGAI